MIKPIIGVDTETEDNKPFIVTTCDETLKEQLYDPPFTRVVPLLRSASIRKAFHNAPYDLYCLARLGICVKGEIHDTMIMSNLMDENQKPKNLKHLARVHLKEDAAEEAELKPHKSRLERERNAYIKELVENFETRSRYDQNVAVKFSWRNMPANLLRKYAKKDPNYTLCLYYLWKDAIKPFERTYRFELMLIPIIVKLSLKGMLIDRPFVAKKIVEYRDAAKKVYKDIMKMLRKKGWEDGDINVGSPTQIRKLFDLYGIKPDKKTKKLAVSTDAEVLQEYAYTYPIIEKIIEHHFLINQLYRYYAKLYFLYTTPKESVARFILYQTGPKSARFSADVIQTIPRPEEVKHTKYSFETRQSFIPRKGRLLVCIDYDQVEMRLFAHFSKSKLIQQYINDGLDTYKEMAYVFFGADIVNRENLTKACRRVSKTSSLSTIYGIGKSKLIRSLTLELGKRVGKEVMKELGLDVKRAHEILDTMYHNYPIRELMSSITAETYKKGYIELKIDSPRMFVDRQYRVPQALAYKGTNLKIQGCAAYVMKYGMVRTDAIIGCMQPTTDLLMTVHDELVFEMDDDKHVAENIRALVDGMEDHVTFDVPLTCTVKVSNKSWGHVESYTEHTKLRSQFRQLTILPPR